MRDAISTYLPAVIVCRFERDRGRGRSTYSTLNVEFVFERTGDGSMCFGKGSKEEKEEEEKVGSGYIQVVRFGPGNVCLLQLLRCAGFLSCCAWDMH